MRTKGWKNVFAFTFIQQVKTKSFIISTIIITLVIALITGLANVLPLVFLSGSDSGGDTSSSNQGAAVAIDKLYFNDRTGMGFDFSGNIMEMGINYEALSDEAAEAKITELITSPERAVVSIVTYDQNRGFNISTSYAGDNSGLGRNEANSLNDMLSSGLKIQYMLSLGLSPDEVAVSMSYVSSSSAKAGEEPVSMVREIMNTVVPMISSIILFIFIFSYSQLVAQSVALEKSSRIMEYLLTSIKPLAVIIGKVLAMCCISLMQFLIIGMGGALGVIVTLPFGILSKLGNIASMAGASLGEEASAGISSGMAGILDDLNEVLSSIDPLSIVVMIVVFILGFLFYATLAGLTGASISKMEDLAAALQPLSIIGVLGFYLAYFPQITAIDGGDNAFMTLARYLPISSPFIIPSDYMLGKISLGEMLLCVAVLVAADILLTLLVAKVYEHIVLHMGNRLKFSDMLKLAKNTK